MPIVLKYPAPILLVLAVVLVSGPASNPWTVMLLFVLLPASTGMVEAATSTTLGSAASSSSICSKSASERSGVYPFSRGETRKVIRLSDWIPSSTRLTLIKLRVNRPAMTSKAIDSPICAVASPLRNRFAVRPPVDRPVCPFKVADRSGLVLCHAGSSPNSSPVASASAPVNRSIVASRRNSMMDVASGGSIDAIKASVQRATSRPPNPPNPASSHDSASSCRMSCPRVAPIDSRTAISPARSAVLASSKLAMFTQASSSTTPVTLSSRNNGGAASRRRLLCPRAPGVSAICLAANRSRVRSVRPCCKASSTSLMIATYGTLTPVLAASIDTPGDSLANR